MKRDFEARMAEIENIILSMNERGDEWFEENIRLANVQELVQRERVQDRFQREVVANTEGLIDERVEELIDWMKTALTSGRCCGSGALGSRRSADSLPSRAGPKDAIPKRSAAGHDERRPASGS